MVTGPKDTGAERMPSAVRYGLAIPYRQAMPAVRVVVITAVVIAAFWTIGCSAGDPSVVTPNADVVSDEVATDAVVGATYPARGHGDPDMTPWRRAGLDIGEHQRSTS